MSECVWCGSVERGCGGEGYHWLTTAETVCIVILGLSRQASREVSGPLGTKQAIRAWLKTVSQKSGGSVSLPQPWILPFEAKPKVPLIYVEKLRPSSHSLMDYKGFQKGCDITLKNMLRAQGMVFT